MDDPRKVQNEKETGVNRGMKYMEIFISMDIELYIKLKSKRLD